MRENSCGYPWQEQPGADAVRCGNGAGGNPHLGARSVGREITAASRLHVLSGPWRDRILNVVGLPVPDATGGRLEILCRLGGEK